MLKYGIEENIFNSFLYFFETVETNIQVDHKVLVGHLTFFCNY